MSAASSQDDDDNDYKPFIRTLLLSWFAYQHQSFLGATVLVETALVAYRNGCTVGKLQLELAFLSLQQQGDEGMRQLQPLDNDLLLSFVAATHMVCQV